MATPPGIVCNDAADRRGRDDDPDAVDLDPDATDISCDELNDTDPDPVNLDGPIVELEAELFENDSLSSGLVMMLCLRELHAFSFSAK